MKPYGGFARVALVCSITIAWCSWVRGEEAAADAVDVRQSEAEALFDEHADKGTLFDFTTAQQFRLKGWGDEYANLVRTRWKQQSREGIRLELKELPKHTYRVGQPFDCFAILKNDGQAPRLLSTGGNCGMTHELGILVVEPGGGLGLGYCRGKVGGPHCFCQPKRQNIEPGKEVKLATGFASDAAVAWKPARPGVYLVIGTYQRKPAGKPTSTVYSAPLAITVE